MTKSIVLRAFGLQLQDGEGVTIEVEELTNEVSIKIRKE